MTLLELALQAQLPIIQVETEDTLNALHVLRYVVGEPVHELTEKEPLEKSAYRYCMAWDYEGSIEDLYSYLIEAERTVVLVNCDKENPLIFNAGQLPVPPELVLKHLSAVIEESAAERLLPVLGGLTLKEIMEVGRMAMAHYGCLTTQGVMSVRRLMMTRLKGVFQVDTQMPFYFPVEELEKWCDINGPLFLKCPEDRLVPRGLLFDGPPGTGKTAAAKYIANRFQVPLWVMDLGSTMGKYVGESEGQLNRNLQQIDAEAPGILLLDEVEKIFKTNGDEGVATRMLSRLLWWLQEHRTRILTVMTTNHLEVIPPELYREGRVDKVMQFEGLPQEQVEPFTFHLVDSFKHITGVPEAYGDILVKVWKEYDALKGKKKDFKIQQSKVTQWVNDAVKIIASESGN